MPVDEDVEREQRENRPVRGHLCAGLRVWQGASTYGCIPKIYEDGVIAGCDDNNPVHILYCPMCGEKLPAPPVSEAEHE